jgi:hypothetical protein
MHWEGKAVKAGARNMNVGTLTEARRKLGIAKGMREYEQG